MRCVNGTCDLDPDGSDDDYWLISGLTETEIRRTRKYFCLTLSKGELRSDLKVDFDDVNHDCVIETIQELINIMETECWTIRIS